MVKLCFPKYLKPVSLLTYDPVYEIFRCGSNPSREDVCENGFQLTNSVNLNTIENPLN